VLQEVDFGDQQSFADAQRGLIATRPDLVVKSADGREVWDLSAYDFLQQVDASPSVNPSLWRQARLNMHHGLFKVVEGIYQMRGFDMSNMTVEMVFQPAPESEAPAEMTVYFPQFRVFDSAELACDTLHNLLTLRGAPVRDASKWASHLNAAIALYGDRTDVVIAQHTWPKWGQECVIRFLTGQRDLYKYIHDQTVRLMNQGYTVTQIAEMLALPASLGRQWFARGYYGTVSHNVNAVYQKYIGWYDANPANLLPAVAGGGGPEVRRVHGGAQAVIDRARLMGAYELRNGVVPRQSASGEDTATATTLSMYFDYLGVRLNGAKAGGTRIVLNWDFTDVGEQYVLNLENAALTYLPGHPAADADATVTLARATPDAITLGQTTFEREAGSRGIRVASDPRKLAELYSMLDTFERDFNIVTP
jgi:alkyl sulfatase BDS1-like metallo-beta-lactamase superfamily hydrolase